jgi:hypothetical protein
MTFLSDDEIREMCAPLVQPSAQVRYLRKLGIHCQTKPNGRPLVVRSHAEAVLAGMASTGDTRKGPDVSWMFPAASA